MRLFTLTELTGRQSNADRTITVASFPARPRHLATAAISGVIAAIFTAIAWAFIGYYAALIFLALMAILMWLLNATTKDSRQIRQYRALIDSMLARASIGRFYVGHNQVNPLRTESGVFLPATKQAGDTTSHPVLSMEKRYTDLHASLQKKSKRRGRHERH